MVSYFAPSHSNHKEICIFFIWWRYWTGAKRHSQNLTLDTKYNTFFAVGKIEEKCFKMDLNGQDPFKNGQYNFHVQPTWVRTCFIFLSSGLSLNTRSPAHYQVNFSYTEISNTSEAILIFFYSICLHVCIKRSLLFYVHYPERIPKNSKVFFFLQINVQDFYTDHPPSDGGNKTACFSIWNKTACFSVHIFFSWHSFGVGMTDTRHRV